MSAEVDNRTDIDESFFDDLYAEAAAPLLISLDPECTVTVAVPDGDLVADLDDVAGPVETLEVLLDADDDPDGADDLDELLDRYRTAADLACLADAIREHFALAVAPADGWAGLVDMLDRWGWGIEWDLLHLPNGPTLGDFVRDPTRWPWTLLDRVLELLPQGSGYWAALMDDDELAEDQHNQEQRGRKRAPSTRPPLLGWTREAQRQTDLIDVARQGVHATWGASPKFKGKGGRPPKASPRPRGAYQRVGRRRLLVEHDEIVGMLLPRGVEPPPDDALVDDAYRDEHSTPDGRADRQQRTPPPEAVRGAVLLDPHTPFGSRPDP